MRSYLISTKIFVTFAMILSLCSIVSATSPGTFGSMFKYEAGKGYRFIGTNIVDGTINTTQLQDGAVTNSEIVDGTIGSIDVNKDEIQLRTGGIKCPQNDLSYAIQSVNDDGTVNCLKVAANIPAMKYLCSGASCVRDDTNGTFTTSNCNNTCISAPIPKYLCSGASCVRDDTNGTFTTSNCNNTCAVVDSYGACGFLPGNCGAGSSLNGSVITNPGGAKVWHCYKDGTSAGYIAAHFTPNCIWQQKYLCSGSSCIRDDINGTFTAANCDNMCTSTPNGTCAANTMTNGTIDTLSHPPVTLNTPLQNTNSSAPCYYTCINGYTGINCQVPPPVNGECGTANGTPISYQPTTSLCQTGTASTISGLGPWEWTCAGFYGGNIITCNAPKKVIGTKCSCIYHLELPENCASGAWWDCSDGSTGGCDGATPTCNAPACIEDCAAPNDVASCTGTNGAIKCFSGYPMGWTKAGDLGCKTMPGMYASKCN